MIAAKLGVAVVLSIVHVMQGCHVFSPGSTVQVKPGARVSIRISCPMDFDVVQTAGPKISLGDPRWHTGTLHVLVFKKKGVYRFTATNVQTPEQVGLQTLGQTKTPKLTVLVR